MYILGEENLPARLRKLADELGSVNLLAQKSGISQSGIRRYFEGGEPSRKALVALANATGVTIEWLATGGGPMRTRDLYAFVALYKGQGKHEFNLHLVFSQRWLNDEFEDVDPTLLVAFVVSDESMAPTLMKGDQVLVDKRKKNRSSAGLYLIELNGNATVKRLQPFPNRSIRVLSDHSGYADFDIEFEHRDSLEIIGEVRWVGRKLG